MCTCGPSFREDEAGGCWEFQVISHTKQDLVSKEHKIETKQKTQAVSKSKPQKKEGKACKSLQDLEMASGTVCACSEMGHGEKTYFKR